MLQIRGGGQDCLKAILSFEAIETLNTGTITHVKTKPIAVAFRQLLNRWLGQLLAMGESPVHLGFLIHFGCSERNSDALLELRESWSMIGSFHGPVEAISDQSATVPTIWKK